MKTIFILGVYLLVFVMMLLASCKPEPLCMDQLNFYEIPGCHPIVGKDGDVYQAPPGEIFVVKGCIRPVSELLHERDSLINELNAIIRDCPKIIYNAWQTGYATAWTHKYDNTTFNEQRKRDSILFIKDVLQYSNE